MNKLKPIHKEFIIKLINNGEKSNQTILEKLKNEYDVSVSSTMISKIRQTKNVYNSNFFSLKESTRIFTFGKEVDYEHRVVL